MRRSRRDVDRSAGVRVSYGLCGLTGGRGRQREGERGTLAECAVDPHAATVGNDEPLHDEKAETRPGNFGGRRRRDASELLEKVRNLFRRDAFSWITNRAACF